MNTDLRTILIAITAGALGGYLAASQPNNGKQPGRAREDGNSSLAQSGNHLRFEREETRGGYLAGKEGFSLKLDDLEYKARFKNAPPLGIFHNAQGVSYRFQAGHGQAQLSCRIIFHDGQVLHAAFMSLDERGGEYTDLY